MSYLDTKLNQQNKVLLERVCILKFSLLLLLLRII